MSRIFSHFHSQTGISSKKYTHSDSKKLGIYCKYHGIGVFFFECRANKNEDIATKKKGHNILMDKSKKSKRFEEHIHIRGP